MLPRMTTKSGVKWMEDGEIGKVGAHVQDLVVGESEAQQEIVITLLLLMVVSTALVTE